MRWRERAQKCVLQPQWRDWQQDISKHPGVAQVGFRSACLLNEDGCATWNEPLQPDSSRVPLTQQSCAARPAICIIIV
jgi:hypothetical protein